MWPYGSGSLHRTELHRAYPAVFCAYRSVYSSLLAVLAVRVLYVWGCGPGPFRPSALYQIKASCWSVGWHLQPGGGGGGREPQAPCLADRAAARAVVVPPPASSTRTPSPFPSRRRCGSLRPPCACSLEAWAVAQVASRQSRLWSRQLPRYRNCMPCTRVGAAVGPRAPVCLLRLGQPSALGWSGWARLLCTLCAVLRWAPLLLQGVRSRRTEVRLPRGSGCGMPV